MNIIFTVNQAAALKLGINAPSSTQVIDIDPAELTQDERDMLASKITEGHRATSISLDRPDVQGVKERLGELIAQRQKQDAETKLCEDKLRREVSDKLRKLFSDAGTIKIYVGVNAQGEKDPNYWVASKGVEVPEESSLSSYYLKYLTPEQRAQHDEWVARRAAERKTLFDAAAEELRTGPYQKWLTQQAAEKADYDSLYQRLPEPLRKRDAKRYAESGEVLREIRKLIRADAGLAEYGQWSWYRDCRADSLTDEEFAALEEFEAKLPQGAEVEVREVTDRGNPLEDVYGEPELDEDGGTDYERVNRRVVAVAEWKRAGVTTKAVCHLGNRPDAEDE